MARKKEELPLFDHLSEDVKDSVSSVLIPVDKHLVEQVGKPFTVCVEMINNCKTRRKLDLIEGPVT